VVRDEQARLHLQGVVNFVSGERRMSDGDAERMLERSLPTDGTRSRAETRVVASPERADATRPFDDQWFARLPDAVALAETRALAVGMRETFTEKHDDARREAAARRETLEFACWVREAAGLAEPPPVLPSHAEKNELTNLQRFISQQLLREREWNHEQVEQIREFAHRAPEKDQEKLATALDRQEQRIERDRVVRERGLLGERSAGLNEAMTKADSRFAAEVFGRLDLAQLREPERVREETERLARQYLDAAKELGLRPEQVKFRSGSAEDQARLTVAWTVEQAERLRVAWVLAAADSPSVERLRSRLDMAGIEVDMADGDGRAAPAIRLKLGDASFDTHALERRIDVSKILSGKGEFEDRRKARGIEKCVQLALLSPEERDKRVFALQNQSGPRSLARAEEMHRAEYARLAVAAVRSGAAPNWEAIDRRIEGMPTPAGATRDNEWLVKTWGVTRLSEVQRTAQAVPSVRLVREIVPDRSPTRTPYEPGRTTPSRTRGGGGGSRGR
jgi:hypothetical protein